MAKLITFWGRERDRMERRESGKVSTFFKPKVMVVSTSNNLVIATVAK